MSFICNDKHISGNITYNEDGIGTCEKDCAKEHLFERSKHMTKAVAFLKFSVDLIFFVTVNRLIFLLPIYIIISLVTLNAVSILLKNKIETIIREKTKVNTIDEAL